MGTTAYLTTLTIHELPSSHSTFHRRIVRLAEKGIPAWLVRPALEYVILVEL